MYGVYLYGARAAAPYATRFTIGSTNDKVLSFWEPGAPNFNERLSCLQYAFNKGYRTSVSCEPYLDGFVVHTYEACAPYITDSFWIGMLRNWNSRVREPKPFPSPIEKKIFDRTHNAQKVIFVKALYSCLNGLPYIKWKDSIREIMGI